MRICLVAHGLPPRELTGVEGHVAALAAALADRGPRVHVVAPERDATRPRLRERRESRGSWEVTWFALDDTARTAAEAAEPLGLAARFGAWLDRERPDVCHVHHLLGLGPGLVEAARARGIPVVWTAHDLWAVCHRWTLLRPDLGACSGPDPEGCARCDLAVAHLNALPGLGDYHVGVDPADLAPEDAARLRALLHGDPAAAGVGAEEVAVARAERARLDAARHAALASVDLALAPTRHLRDVLVGAGFDPRRVHVRPYAIPTRDLAGLEPPVPRTPIRFGFVGGVVKHKGLHVLLEAFGRLDVPAELAIHGDSNDRPYVERVQRAAERVGARWHGAFQRPELPEVLAGIDVLVVPSLWSENQPFVIREAFAAGRPVVASATPALAESVRDGADGLLVPGGDVEALAAALRRLATDPATVRRLAAGVPRVPELADEAGELLELYAELAREARAREADELPVLDCARGLAERRAELARAPVADLHGSVLAGLARLADGLGVGAAVGADAPPAETRLAERLRQRFADARAEVAWLRDTLASSAEAERALAERAEWHARGARDRAAELRERQARSEADAAALRAARDEAAWLREVLAARDDELRWRERTAAELEAALEAEREARAAQEDELAWRRGEAGAREAELAWLREQRSAREAELAWLRSVLDAREAEVAWLRGTDATREEELAWLRSLRETAEEERAWRAGREAAVGAERDWLRSVLAARDEEVRWRRETVEQLEREAAWLREVRAGLEAERDAAGAARADAEAARDEAAAARAAERAELTRRCEELERELGWRRAEMDEALRDGGRVLRRLLARTALGRRLRSWRLAAEAPRTGEGPGEFHGGASAGETAVGGTGAGDAGPPAPGGTP